MNGCGSSHGSSCDSSCRTGQSRVTSGGQVQGCAASSRLETECPGSRRGNKVSRKRGRNILTTTTTADIRGMDVGSLTPVSWRLVKYVPAPQNSPKHEDGNLRAVTFNTVASWLLGYLRLVYITNQNLYPRQVNTTVH